MSSVQTFTPRSGGGTSPLTTRWANPSTTAVLPTPASARQNRIVLPAPGENIDDLPHLRVAARAPGPICPWRARSVRSMVN